MDMMFLRCILVLTVIPSMTTSVNTKEPLHLIGLYPFTGPWPAGETIHAVSEMAIDHINANQSVLPDYELTLITGDSAVSTLVCYH